MKSILLCLTILGIFSTPSFAENIRLDAKQEFQECMSENKKERKQCNFGGCGNIIGACYDRQLNEIFLSTSSLENKINLGKCAKEAKSISTETENLAIKLKTFPIFDGTWGGYETQVEIALLKNKMLDILVKECATSN